MSLGVGVNVGSDQSAVFQVDANQAAAVELRNIEHSVQNDQIIDKTLAQKILTGKAAEQGREAVKNLINTLSDSGLKLTAESFSGKIKNSNSNVKDEYDLMFQSKQDVSDKADIHEALQTVTRAGGKKSSQQGQGESGEGQSGPQDPAKFNAALKEYTAAFIQLAVNGGTSIKKKTEALETALRDEGMTEQQLLGMKSEIRTQMRGQIASQLREGFIKKLMGAPKSLDFGLGAKEIDSIMKFAFEHKELGGDNFGNFKGNGLKGTARAVEKEAAKEMRQFVKEELMNEFVAQRTGSKNDAEIKELVKLGERVKIDFGRMSQDISLKMFHEGCCPVPAQAFANSMLMQGGMQDQNKKKDSHQFTKEDEADLFKNQLRMLYMKRALKGGIASILETSFKVTRLKNGLLRLGVNFGDMDRLEQEGRALARVKVVEMLKEALNERATLYELSGPAFSLNESKIKGLSRNLQGLGVELSDGQFEEWRDDANRQMFDVAENEFLQTRTVHEVNPQSVTEKKLKLLEKLMYRLKEESNLEYEVPAIVLASVSAAV